MTTKICKDHSLRLCLPATARPNLFGVD